ncbi:MAG: aldo/keto reductase [Hyphomicrobiaceae bacterium]
MLTRKIVATGEDMPVIGLGTWQVFDVEGTAEELAQRREVLDVLFKAGGRMIDSSPMYGRAEAITGTLLQQMQARDKAYLATKVWTTGEAAGTAQMQASMAKMQAGKTIDLIQIHNLVDWRTHLKTLRKWKDEGRVRAIGITHYTVSSLDDLAAVIRAEKIDVVQLVHSIGVRAADDRLLPLCAEKGVATIINQPFGQGAHFRKVKGKPLPDWAAEMGIASWGQLFLKFIVSHPAVTCVIPGTSKAEHMRDNVAAGSGVMPDAKGRQRLAAVWDGM